MTTTVHLAVTEPGVKPKTAASPHARELARLSLASVSAAKSVTGAAKRRQVESVATDESAKKATGATAEIAADDLHDIADQE